MWQAFDCVTSKVSVPDMQYFDETGQRTGYAPGLADMVPLRAALKLNRARTLVCGKTQPDAPLLGSLADVRTDAKARFSSGTVK